MEYLELLAPARNADIGIAAIDCGADAVYMAGEEFGARKDAGNTMADVARVCEHAHRFGARVFLTVNTIIYDNELDRVHRLMLDAQEAGVDAFIVQDLALTGWDDIKVPLHASTQCAIRDSAKALFYKSLGFSRLVLERESSLEDIRKIKEAVAANWSISYTEPSVYVIAGNAISPKESLGAAPTEEPVSRPAAHYTTS